MENQHVVENNGGQGGIRTLGTLSRTHAFQACALNHSATCPFFEKLAAGQLDRSGGTYIKDSAAINPNLTVFRQSLGNLLSGPRLRAWAYSAERPIWRAKLRCRCLNLLHHSLNRFRFKE